MRVLLRVQDMSIRVTECAAWSLEARECGAPVCDLKVGERACERDMRVFGCLGVKNGGERICVHARRRMAECWSLCWDGWVYVSFFPFL